MLLNTSSSISPPPHTHPRSTGCRRGTAP
jgi:hypothetical protein